MSDRVLIWTGTVDPGDEVNDTDIQEIRDKIDSWFNREYLQCPIHNTTVCSVYCSGDRTSHKSEVCTLFCSDCPGYGCVAYTCTGDICVGDGCSDDVCVGDVCVGDECSDDICVGDVCVGDVCVGDDCVGDGCVGDICVSDICESDDCSSDVECTNDSECSSDACTQDTCTSEISTVTACFVDFTGNTCITDFSVNNTSDRIDFVIFSGCPLYSDVSADYLGDYSGDNLIHDASDNSDDTTCVSYNGAERHDCTADQSSDRAIDFGQPHLSCIVELSGYQFVGWINAYTEFLSKDYGSYCPIDLPSDNVSYFGGGHLGAYLSEYSCPDCSADYSSDNSSHNESDECPCNTCLTDGCPAECHTECNYEHATGLCCFRFCGWHNLSECYHKGKGGCTPHYVQLGCNGDCDCMIDHYIVLKKYEACKAHNVYDSSCTIECFSVKTGGAGCNYHEGRCCTADYKAYYKEVRI